MQAAYYERIGSARDVLQLGELPDPSPGPGEVRVRLHWSGVNPSDAKSRAGLRSPEMPFPRVVPHSDGMGVVDAVGDGVDRGRVGERVWVWNAAWGRPWGTAAQHVVLPSAQAVVLPSAVADEAGACLGIPALTALHAMLTGGGVQGRTVLVAGGAGSVGHYAVQFARLLGAHRVLATASTDAKAALAREAGADAVVDYRAGDAAARLRDAAEGRGIDRIVEVDIGANAALDAEAVRADGEIVVYGSGRPAVELPFFPLLAKNVALRFFIVYNLPPRDRDRALRTLDDFLMRGALVHNIALRLPLDRIVEAHEKVERGEVTGNVVLRIP